ncbi:glutaredoxin family protein [Rugamonas sp. CCM 8940]|uniref:glutaredoxin family protein n=1 Tax=Rugamonas sp. CCM 8940 TaxID=2765359 RepID=UPI0018F4AA82|nr:glutaredoxin family protein [Rugamonas sp. CCM 8940]MBJ7312022.1 glutaredoxin family protein [Rugamonas sp. CCM 8940]
MYSLPIKKILQCTLTLAAMVPAAVYPQSLEGLLKTLQQATSSNTVDAFKSVADVIQSQLPPGASAQNAEGKVVLYRTARCEYCKRAAAYMRQKSIPFAERNIDANAGYKAEYTSLGGNGGVPLIIFGAKAIYGFAEASFEKNYADFQISLADKSHGTPTPAGTGAAPQAGCCGQVISDTTIGWRAAIFRS